MRKLTRDDVIAGLTGAIASTPQSMAFALIAGVNPMYGLYTAIVATITGAIFGHSSTMTVGTTNALALVVASTLTGLDQAIAIEQLFVLTLLVGIFHLSFGLLRIGSLVRFVSNAVMTGFIAGAALLIIFGQLRYLNGYTPAGDTSLLRVIDWLQHLHQSDVTILAASAISAVTMLAVRRTQYKTLATLIGIIVTSGIAVLAGWGDVTIVRDIAIIPATVPAPQLPQLRYAADLIPAAFAIAILGAVQSAALLNMLPEKHGQRPRINRDFIGMGIANMAGSLFQTMPACGSLSRTAVNIAAGAQTRWSNVFAGVFVALFLLVFGRLIEYVTLSALGVMLIIAATGLIRPAEIRLVWKSAPAARIAMVITFATALVFPIEYSIYAGVFISLMMYLYASSEQVNVTRLIPIDETRFRVDAVPSRLPDHEVTVLAIQGHLYFAAISRLEKLLPDPWRSQGSVVIIRLRDCDFLASTGIHFFERYEAALRHNGGQLILTGLSHRLYTQLQQMPGRFSPVTLFEADDILLEGTRRAYLYAQTTGHRG